MGLSIMQCTAVLIVFKGPVCRTAKKTERELNWTDQDQTSGLFMDQSFSVQFPFFHFEKYSRTHEKLVKTGCNWSSVPMHVGPYSHAYLLHFRSLDHQTWSRIGWDMTKNISVQVFCCIRTTLIALHNCVHSIIGTVFAQRTQLLKSIYIYPTYLSSYSSTLLVCTTVITITGGLMPHTILWNST